MNNYGITTTANTVQTTSYYNVQPYTQYVPYPVLVTGEPTVSKHETAFKVVSTLIEEGIIDGDKLKLKDFIALVAKLVEDVL